MSISSDAETTLDEARALAEEASAAEYALKRAQRIAEDLIDTRGALEEIAAIAYSIERSLVRASMAADALSEDLREARRP